MHVLAIQETLHGNVNNKLISTGHGVFEKEAHGVLSRALAKRPTIPEFALAFGEKKVSNIRLGLR